MRTEFPPEVWEEIRRLYPAGKVCPCCGERLEVEDFGLRKREAGWRPKAFCRECAGAKNREQNVQHRVLKVEAVPDTRKPIPSLNVGHRYEITDTGRRCPWRDYGGEAEPNEKTTYSGPCVGRYGINWAVRTSTGIRTFTAGQLVGLQIKEVANCA